MRHFSTLLLTAALFCSAYSDTVVLPSRSGLSFSPFSTFRDNASSLSCAVITQTTDFYWCYYEGCTCMCPCCPGIAVASKRPFYVSKKAMDYSGYLGNPAKLADTTLFAKCSTSTPPFGTGCLISSAALVQPAANLGLVPGGLDSLPTRLLVFQTIYQMYVPVRIDGVASHYGTCMNSSYIIYDTLRMTYGNSLTGIHTGSMNGALASGSPLSVAESRGSYSISGLDAGENRLEIYNVRGQAVFSRSVNSSSFSIGKNVLGPGLYILYVHSRIGVDRIVFPVR
jgi:hypothetical protein